MKSTELLAWIDIETTGLNLDTDSLLEVALIVTTQDLEELFKDSWALYARKPDDVHSVVDEMHTASGLWEDSMKIGLGLKDFVEEFRNCLRALLKIYPEYTKFVMAGSGVARFDYTWFQYHHSNIIQDFFAYYTLDTGVVRRALELSGVITVRDDETQRKTLNHRAMNDIEDHLEEWKKYRSMFATLDPIEDWEPNAWRTNS